LDVDDPNAAFLLRLLSQLFQHPGFDEKGLSELVAFLSLLTLKGLDMKERILDASEFSVMRPLLLINKILVFQIFHELLTIVSTIWGCGQAKLPTESYAFECPPTLYSSVNP
jgi:hypothetical protein